MKTTVGLLIALGLASAACGGVEVLPGEQAGGTGAGGGGGNPTGGAGGAACAPVGGPADAIDAWIAFDSDREGFRHHLFAVRPNGCDLHQLTSGAFNDTQPAWSPDGTRIAFVSDRDGPASVHVLEIATMKVVSLPDAACSMPSWSPDGASIVCASDTRMFVLSASEPAKPKLTLTTDNQAAEWPVYQQSGSAIVYDGLNEILSRDLASGKVTFLVPNEPDTEEMPAISKDGTLLAFATYCEQSIESIWVTPIGGFSGWPCDQASRVTPLGEPFATRPAWGPSNMIAFQRGKSPAALAVIESGGQPFNLVTTADNKNPSWSPVGAKLP
jgi:Tol biopolymer transport system component